MFLEGAALICFELISDIKRLACPCEPFFFVELREGEGNCSLGRAKNFGDITGGRAVYRQARP